MIKRIKNRLNKLNEIIAKQDKQSNRDSLYIGNNLALTKLFTGQKLYVDTRDTSIAPHLLLDGAWEQGTSNLFLRLIHPNDTVIDAGADFGYYGCIASSKLADGGFVIFAEANPVYVDFLKKNIALSGLGDRSYIANFAVSNKNGDSVSFRVLKDDWASSSAMSDKDFEESRSVEYEVESKITVKTATIDEIVKKAGKKSVNVIKMDIEGFEEKAITGMKQTIKKSPDLKLLIEFSTAAYKNPKKLFDYLKSEFANVYKVDIASGNLQEITNFRSVSKKQDILLFSKSQVA